MSWRDVLKPEPRESPEAQGEHEDAWEADVLRHLAAIGETEPELIAETLERCQRDPHVRAFFVGKGRAAPC